jgi:hypothetical protein
MAYVVPRFNTPYFPRSNQQNAQEEIHLVHDHRAMYTRMISLLTLFICSKATYSFAPFDVF